MENNSNSRISIANVLAMLGLAAIGVITFFGAQLHSTDGTPTQAIIWAIVTITVLGFLLFMSIKAKGAEDNVDKWKYVEWTSLALYVVAAALLCLPFQRMAYVMLEKSELQAQANKELKAIDDMYNSYKRQWNKALDSACEDFTTYSKSGQYQEDNAKVKAGGVPSEMYEFYKDVVYPLDGFREKVTKVVEVSSNDPCFIKLKELKGMVANWNLMTLSSLAIELKKLEVDSRASLDRKITKFAADNNFIPVIAGLGNSYDPYRVQGLAEFDLGQAPNPEFATMIQESNGHTIQGWIVYVLLHLLILLNYLVAPRSFYVGVQHGHANTGGLDL